QQRDGPHPEQALEDDEPDEDERHDPWLGRVSPVEPRDDGERDADEPQRAREIPVKHLPPRLAGLERTAEFLLDVRLDGELLGDEELAVASRPVRAAE